MEVKSLIELIEANMAFSDKTRIVFRFGDVEVIPLLEKIEVMLKAHVCYRGKQWDKDEVIILKNHRKNFAKRLGGKKAK